MALTEIYVDPSIAADSGAGTIGDPYGDLEYAIEQETFDTTNGTRVNIKAGTDEVLAAKLETAVADTSVSIAWVPSLLARAVFQGYTSIAGDGGIGGISGGGAVGMFEDQTLDNITVQDMHVHNTGSAVPISIDSNSFVLNCEVNNTTSTTFTLAIDQGAVIGCYVHDFEGTGIRGDGSALITNNYVWDDGATPNLGIQGAPATIERNIIVFTGTHGAKGITDSSLDWTAMIKNNSIFAVAGTGSGIEIANGGVPTVIINNLIEGFSGAGGDGIGISGGSNGIGYYGGNAVFNCTNTYIDPTRIFHDAGDNETLTASPFVDAANGDFSPTDEGNIKEGSLPSVIGGNFV